jgi:hypothetical protein
VKKSAPIDPVAEATQQAEERARAEAARREAAQEPDFTLPRAEARVYEKAKRVVIAAAMNNAPVSKKFWAALQAYAKRNEAEFLVQPMRYRNPTSPQESKKQEEGLWWAKEVQPHLSTNRLQLHRLLWYMGDVPVAATALNPLTGLDSMTRGASAVFGHGQMAMETVPTPQNVLPKILHTTGAVTEPIYSKSKAGRRAEFHHTLASLVIEKSGSAFHLRQLIADSEGGFYDIAGGEARYYHAGGSRKAERALALVTGDTHVDRVDPTVVKATYDKGGLVGVLRPKQLIWHDLLDFQSDSHWNNPVERIALAFAGKHNVREEVKRALGFVEFYTPTDTLSVIVPSNHNDHLARWALESDWRRVTPMNAAFLLQLQLALVRGAKAKASGVEQVDPLAWWAYRNLTGGTQIRFLRRGESHRVGGVEVGFHGDKGPNGSRGSRKNLDRMGTRSIIGHSHSPGIYRGTRQVGTSSYLDLSYGVGGPSSWLQTHAVIWPNGKSQLINVIDGQCFA